MNYYLAMYSNSGAHGLKEKRYDLDPSIYLSIFYRPSTTTTTATTTEREKDEAERGKKVRKGAKRDKK